MIDKDEIIEKSEKFEIHSSNVQRDYVFGWVLSGIYTVSKLKDVLVLKGGNCLRKAYFEDTRFSNDLDFSVNTELQPQFIENELKVVCDYVSEMSGVVFEKDRSIVREKKGIDVKKVVYEARLYFKDFFGDDSQMIISIRLDITQFERIYLPIQQRHIIHPYSDYDKCSILINCTKVEEVLASKLKCLLQRRHSSDLYDYVFWLFFNTQIEINRTEIVSTLLKLTIFERGPGALYGLLVELPFQILKGLYEQFLVCPKKSIIPFDEAVIKFRAHIEELFGDLKGKFGQLAFFPAKLRNVILEAGSQMKLLQLTYDGYTRKVEPYSLVFKVRKDGHGQEYFYGWDRTGGSSGPGIKAFVHDKVNNISILEERFEPRFLIEVTKAGEPIVKRFVGRSRSLYPRVTASKRVYLFECPVCHKTFSRKSRDSKLNEHKDKYGNRCYGKRGIYRGIK